MNFLAEPSNGPLGSFTRDHSSAATHHILTPTQLLTPSRRSSRKISCRWPAAAAARPGSPPSGWCRADLSDSRMSSGRWVGEDVTPAKIYKIFYLKLFTMKRRWKLLTSKTALWRTSNLNQANVLSCVASVFQDGFLTTYTYVASSQKVSTSVRGSPAEIRFVKNLSFWWKIKYKFGYNVKKKQIKSKRVYTTDFAPQK